MRRRAALPVVLALAFALVVAACGGSAGDTSGDTASGGNTGSGGNGGSTDAGSVTITAANGDVVLPAPATRIVALEWVYAEDAMLVGVAPVGVADRKGYIGYVGAPPALPDDIVDVGTRQEPNLEAIRALQPDLILGITMRHETILSELESIAPTALFDPYSAPGGQLQEMEDTFTQIATATGKVSEGEAVLAELDATIESATSALSGRTPEDRRILVVQPYVQNDIPIIRAFTGDALAMQLFERLGLTNAWTQPGDSFGFTTTDLEGLTTVTDASVLYTADADDIDRGGFVGNPLWDQWAPVVDGRLHPLGANAWTYGGPASAEYLVAQLMAQLG